MTGADDDRPTVYLAGPVAHADAAGEPWRRRVMSTFDDRFDFENPLDKYNVPADNLTIVPGHASRTAQENGRVGVADIVEGDKTKLLASDAVLVGYDPVRSVGTPMEVMWAYMHHYPVALWIRDGHADMDALSPWYRYHVDAVSASAEDALAAIEAELSDDVPEPPDGYAPGTTEYGSVVHYVDFDTDSMLARGNGDPDAALCGRTGEFEAHDVELDSGDVCAQCAERAADGGVGA